MMLPYWSLHGGASPILGGLPYRSFIPGPAGPCPLLRDLSGVRWVKGIVSSLVLSASALATSKVANAGSLSTAVLLASIVVVAAGAGAGAGS